MVVAFDVNTDPFAVGLGICQSGCETAGAAWQAGTLETSNQLGAVVPDPADPGCAAALWFPGGNPSIGLADQGAAVAYEAYVLEQCSGGQRKGIQVVRFLGQ